MPRFQVLIRSAVLWCPVGLSEVGVEGNCGELIFFVACDIFFDAIGGLGIGHWGVLSFAPDWRRVRDGGKWKLE